MNTNNITIPVGNAVLGRVLNGNGAPIDQKGSLDNAPRVPLYTLDVADETVSITPTRMLETGIKATDLMAPVPCGGVVRMVGGYDVGAMVVMEEIMHNLITRRRAVVVFAGMSETTYDASAIRDMVREIEAEDQIVMVFEQMTDALPTRQRLLRTAMTIAAQFRDEGQEILLVIDDDIITRVNKADLRNLQHLAAAKGFIAILFSGMNDVDHSTNSDLVGDMDGLIKFSRTRAKQRLWPAVDPLASHSRWLESNAASADHRQVTRRARELLQHCEEQRAKAEGNAPSAEDQRMLARGERLNLFFSQPFTVAEAYTDLPGTFLSIAETVNSFRDLLDGRYDDMPMEAFYFAGTIERARS